MREAFGPHSLSSHSCQNGTLRSMESEHPEVEEFMELDQRPVWSSCQTDQPPFLSTVISDLGCQGGMKVHVPETIVLPCHSTTVQHKLGFSGSQLKGPGKVQDFLTRPSSHLIIEPHVTRHC